MAEHIEYQGNFSGSQIDTLLAKIQSSQVFTTEEKTKLTSLVNYDDTEIKEDISGIETSLDSHKSDTTNPHQVTKAQVGLGNVDNTSDANKPISTATQAALNNKVDKVNGKGLSTNDFTNEDKSQITTNKNNILKDKAALVELVDAGAKNLLKNVMQSQTVGGVTFTLAQDGSITANGTKTNNDWLYLSMGNTLPAGSYVLSSGLEPQENSGVRVLVATADSLGAAIISTEGQNQVVKKTFSQSYSGLIYAIRISSGYTVSNLVFKPMLCTAEEWAVSQEFVPYAMSNAELTEQVDFLRGKMVYSTVRNSSYTSTYTMNTNDFSGSQVGLYLIYIVNWSTTPSISIYAMAYSGNQTSQSTLSKIFGSDASISLSGATVTYTGAGKIQIIAVL